MIAADDRKKKKQSILELELVTPTLILDRMQKGFAIIALLCCAASICRANEAPPALVNTADTNAMERVLDYTNMWRL